MSSLRHRITSRKRTWGTFFVGWALGLALLVVIYISSSIWRAM